MSERLVDINISPDVYKLQEEWISCGQNPEDVQFMENHANFLKLVRSHGEKENRSETETKRIRDLLIYAKELKMRNSPIRQSKNGVGAGK